MCLRPAPPLHLLVEKIPAVLWTTDSLLRLTSLAGAGLSSVKLDAKDYVERPLHEFLKAIGAGAGPFAAHTRALEGVASVLELATREHDFKAHVEPLREANGTIVGVIGVALDVTEYRVAERALRLSEQSHRSLFDEAPYGICRFTAAGQLLQVNPTMVEMLGYESEADLLLCDLDREIFAEPSSYHDFLEQIARSTTCQGFECAWRHAESRQLTVRLGGRAVRNESREIVYVEMFVENVTERKQLEDQLRQGQKMQAIGQLAGGIAHDFNNLLIVIHGHVERILSEPGESNSHFESLREVEKAANRASTLTQRLLAFSRRQMLKSKVLDLNQVICGMTEMLGRLIGDHIELVFSPDAELGMVCADPSQIEQLLMNLVVNARDAIQGSGKIAISTANVALRAATVRYGVRTAAGEYVAICVSDNGLGMDADTKAHIFEPFFTTKEIDEGTGLGLATVYGVVKQSGGYIWVYSEVGQGATFEIYLPRVSEAAETRPVAVPANASGGNETILLVEDEESVRELISAALTKKGYQVLEACNGVLALELASAHAGKIDLVISDLCMPKLGGQALTAELRRAYPTMKVMFTTGYPGDSVIETPGIDLGAPILQKPFGMRYLAAAVRHVLDGMEIPAPQSE
ncbi:MAG TPA: ATP-binding protein [Candidatus Angelobacter sp.]